jgi:hypothetical protein
MMNTMARFRASVTGSNSSQTQTGVHLRGTVFYSDQLQILVKRDNRRSQSLRVDVEPA